MASFLAPYDFWRMPGGADLSSYEAPVGTLSETGETTLQIILDKAQTAIEDYLGFPLVAHQQVDELAPVLNMNLTAVPQHGPIRAVQSFGLLFAASGGQRQMWTIPTDPMEAVAIESQLPMLFGNVQCDRTDGTLNVVSLAGALGFPWASVYSLSSEIVMSYTAGFDSPATGILAPLIADTQVVSATDSVNFTVVKGQGVTLRQGIAVLVGSQQGVVTSIVGDAIQVSGLAMTPTPGDEVHQYDGISMPAPGWVMEAERDAARALCNLISRTELVGAGYTFMQIGQMQWRMNSWDFDLPQPVKNSLDRHFAFLGAELA